MDNQEANMQHRFCRNPETELNDYISIVIENAPALTPEQLIRELTVFSLTLLEVKRAKLQASASATG